MASCSRSCAGAPGRTVLLTDGVLLGKYDIIIINNNNK